MKAEVDAMYNFCIITASDKGASGERVDESGAFIRDFLERNGLRQLKYIILPDDEERLKSEMIHMCDDLRADIILTTGGTGFSPRDVTPEATKQVIEREVPGIPEAMRAYSMTITKRAMLTRAACGIRKSTLIINLPGSHKAVAETLEYIFEAVLHGLDILKQESGECGR